MTKVMKRQTSWVDRFIAVLLACMIGMSCSLMFVNTNANAAAILSTNGGSTLNNLLGLKRDKLPSYSSFNRYMTENDTLTSSFNVKSKSAGGALKKTKVFGVSGKNTNNFTFYGANFQDIDDSEFQQDLIRCFAELMADRSRFSFSDSDRQAIYNEIKDGCGEANAAMVAALFSDTKADMFSALNIFSPFNGVIGTILGIGVYIIIILIVASTAMDIAYINFPIARNFMYGKDKGGEGGGKSSKPWGVTSDAWSVVNECEAGGDKGYKNANVAYFKRRALTYIVVSILILYLLSGQIAGLIAWLMQLVSGFKLT